MIEFRTFGSLGLVCSDGSAAPATLRQSKALALLSYLAAATSPSFHRREKLATLLWSESDGEHGRGMLRKVLFQLRKCLGPEVLASRGSEEVGLDPAHFWCDATAFRVAIAEGRRRDALRLYQGDFLEGVHVRGAREFERWMEQERGSLRQLAYEAAIALAADAEPGSRAEAVSWARRGLQLLPFDEQALCRVMELLDLHGQRAAALAEYESFGRRLMDDLEVEPSPEARALAERIRGRAAPHRAPGAREAPTAPPSLAVLPFVSLDSASDLLAGSLHLELMRQLANAPGVRVVSRTTVMRFADSGAPMADIATELKVELVLGGSVRAVDGRFRAVAELVDATADRTLWSGAADGSVDAGIPEQVEIARRLGVEVLGALALSPPNASWAPAGSWTTPRDAFPD